MKETGLNCAPCGKQTLHRQETPNHVLHFLITFFTCGLWAIVWVADSIKERPWRCTFCGTTNAAPLPPATPRAPARPVSPHELLVARRVIGSLLVACFALVLAGVLYLQMVEPIFAKREARARMTRVLAAERARITQGFAASKAKFGRVDGVIARFDGAYLLNSPSMMTGAEDKNRNRLGFMIYLTPVLVVEEAGGFVLIEPLEGSMKGKRGWVERSQISRPGDPEVR